MPLIHSDPGWNKNFKNLYFDDTFIRSIAVFGILGNLLTLIVLSRRGMRSSIGWLLFGLALSDSIFLVSKVHVPRMESLAWRVERAKWRANFEYDSHIGIWLYKVNGFIAVLGQTGSILFTLGISSERCIVVRFPLKVKQICTTATSAVLSLVICMLSVGLAVPRLYELDIDSYKNIEDNTVYELVDNYLLDPDALLIGTEVYVNWILTFGQYMIPFIVISTLNIIIYLQVRKFAKLRSGMTQTQKSDLSLSVMLLTVTGVFGLCYFPKLLSAVGFLLYKLGVFGADVAGNFEFTLANNYEGWAEFYRIVILVESLTVVLNSAINFIIYCLVGKRFRKTLFGLFRWKGGESQGERLMARSPMPSTRV